MPTAQEDTQLQRIARTFRWMERIVAPDAPGFAFFGAELLAADFGLAGYERPASLSGKGLSVDEAFAGCVGEGVEHLSRLEWGDEQLVRGTSRTAEHGLDEKSLTEIVRLLGYDADAPTPELDWMPGSRLSDGAALLLPASLCIRRRPDAAATAIPSAISTGCAAGPTHEAATLAALLEAIERDAVALWWMGGRRGRPIGLNTCVRAEVAGLLRHLRQGNEARITWLLNLTSDVGIPCVAALSATVEGRGFACGTAARLDARDAIRAAMLELCQSELGHHLVAAKRRVRGDRALNEADRRKLDRAHNLDARFYDVLQPMGFPEDMPAAQPTRTTDAIQITVEHLRHAGVEPLLVDLTRTRLGVPAVRVISPGLQPFPSSLTTDRLTGVAAQLGARAADPVAFPLF